MSKPIYIFHVNSIWKKVIYTDYYVKILNTYLEKLN